jgi:tellurite resistance protein
MGVKGKVEKAGISSAYYADAFAGIIEAGFLMAAADGELDESELETIAGAIMGLIEDVTEKEIRKILEGAYKSLVKDGWEVRLEKVARRLADSDKDDAAWVALKIAALVAMADDDETDEENEAFYQIADALGYDSDAADEAWNEAYELYADNA